MRHFLVFVAGDSWRSQRAVRALRELLEAHGLEGERVDVVDVLDDPQAAEQYRVLALPMVMRLSPSPAVRVVGDLTDRGAAADLLGLVDGPSTRDGRASQGDRT
jgi:circadian clock protein KaiB